MTDITLKPCPFCGSKKLIWHYSPVGKYYVHCDECECSGPYSNSDHKEEAIKFWNDVFKNNDITLKEIQEICRKHQVFDCSARKCPLNSTYGSQCILLDTTPNEYDLNYLEQRIKEYKDAKNNS